MTLNKWIHSAVASSTASMSCQGPWLRMSSALYKEFQHLSQSKAERSPAWNPPRRRRHSLIEPAHIGWLGTARHGRR